MKLQVTEDHNHNKTHTGELFPGASERQFAYQAEQGGQTSICFECHPPYRNGGKENWSLAHPLYDRYALEIARHTSGSITLKLIGFRNDVVDQRRIKGAAVLRDVVLTTMSFGELVNKIFCDGAQVFEDTEAFPDSIKQAMRGAYPPRI